MSFTKKGGIYGIIFFLMFTSFFPAFHANDSFISTDISSLKYSQEIIIPIDTSLKEAKYQPIDTRITFESSCWAKNQTVHSIRVGYGQGSDLTEIESQIYDLSYTDDTHIDACSLVFLIPQEATGSESYYVLYDDQSTDPPDYPNHFKIKDTHYFYEPISGQLMDFDYYQLIEDDYIIYGIIQRGELLGNGMSNALIKLVPESTEFKTKNAEQIASFAMTYSIDPSGEYTGAQWATEIEKTILVHGNLMVRIQIIGTSPKEDIKTDNIYTYYYSPMPEKKIHVNVKHDVLKTIEIKGNQERDGTYCSLSTIKARSGTIEDMNLGEILPNIHVYNEDETIRSYDIPTDPSADPADWLLSATDDEDLGTHAWFCMDDPSTGFVHGFIFEKNTGFLNGTDDGIQVKTSVKQHVKLPGLEADTGDVFAMRNAYEDGSHDTTLTDDMHVTFNMMYLASATGGYELVDKESVIYQSLVKDRPIYRGNQSDQPVTEEKDRYSLTVLVHNAPSMLLGSVLAAASGRNVSYLTVELYKDNDLASSGSAQRLQLGELNFDFEGLSFSEKIKLIRSMFDFRNSTLFKSVRFPDLEEGIYLIKVYKENPLIGKDRKYIGYSLVDVSEDTKTHITCGKQTGLEVTVENQNKKGIEHVKISLLRDETSISDSITDESGVASIMVPLNKKSPMTLVGLYQGFRVINQDISFGILDRWRTQKTTISIDLYDLDVTVIDTFGLAPAVNTNPLVTSDEMIMPQMIQATQKNPGIYEFQDLYANTYNLKMSYKSFEINEIVSLDEDTSVDITFPAEFTIDFEVLNSYGLPIGDTSYSLIRENLGPTLSLKQGKGSVRVPPGEYELEIGSENEMIAGQQVEIKGDKSLTIISNEGSILHMGMTVLLLIVGIGLCFVFLKMKKKRYGFHILLSVIILLSIFQPWWMLNGQSDGVTTQTTTLLFPAQIITLTSSSEVIGGEISEVPEDFTMILNVLTYLLLVSSFLVIGLIFLSKKFRKITLVIQILIIVSLVLCMVLFFVAMSEVTKVGIGGFSGSDTLSLTIPGQSDQIEISCSWGPSSGMFLVGIALFGGIFLVFQKKLFPLIHRFLPFIEIF